MHQNQYTQNNNQQDCGCALKKYMWGMLYAQKYFRRNVVHFPKILHKLEVTLIITNTKMASSLSNECRSYDDGMIVKQSSFTFQEHQLRVCSSAYTEQKLKFGEVKWLTASDNFAEFERFERTDEKQKS